MATNQRKREALRPDTTLAPIGEPEAEVYVWGMPVCCLAALKEAVVGRDDGNRRLLELRCRCERVWYVTSSLDDHVLRRFVVLEQSASQQDREGRKSVEKASLRSRSATSRATGVR